MAESTLSFIIGAIYMGIYLFAFFITSIYCAYIIINNEGYKGKGCIYKIKKWIKLSWKKKKLYLAIIPHLFDQATDIAVLIEYYELSNNINVKQYINIHYIYFGYP